MGMAAIFFIIPMIFAGSPPVRIQELDKSGVMFEKIGTAYTYGDSWTILTRFKLPRFTEIFKFIELSEEGISVLCNKILSMDHDGICIHWNKEISRKLGVIRVRIEEIRLVTTNRSRSRRGLLNIGGKLSKFLFGTMDDEDASRIYEKLDELEQGNSHYLNMAKQQITLLKTNTDLMSNAIANLTDSHNYLVNKINSVNDKVTKILQTQGTEIKHAYIKSELNELVLFIINQLMTIETSLTDTLLIIEALKHGELSPLMIPPKQFETLYTNISLDHYKEPYVMNIPLISRLAKVHYKVESGEIYLRIVIPLLDNHIFDLNKLYMVPISSQNGDYYMLDLDVNYLLNCTQVHHNVELRESDYLKNCAPVDKDVVVCKNRNIISLALETSTCASQMFRAVGVTVGSTECKPRVVRKVQDSLVPLERPNAWLFWLKGVKYLTCQCPDQEYVFELKQGGVIETLRECRYHLGGYIIPHQKETVTTLEIFQPKYLPLPSINTSKYREILSPENITNSEPLQLLDAKKWREELITNSQTINLLEEELTHWHTRKELGNMSFRSNIFGLVVTIILVLYFIIKIIYCLKNRKSDKDSSSIPQVQSPVNISLPITNLTRPTQRPPPIPVPIGHISHEGEYVVPNTNNHNSNDSNNNP